MHRSSLTHQTGVTIKYARQCPTVTVPGSRHGARPRWLGARHKSAVTFQVADEVRSGGSTAQLRTGTAAALTRVTAT